MQSLLKGPAHLSPWGTLSPFIKLSSAQLFSNRMVYMNLVSYFEFLRIHSRVLESWVVFSWCKNIFFFRWAREPSVFVLFYCLRYFVCCFWRDRSQWARAPSFTRFLDHTQRRATFGRTPPDEWSARRRDLYLTTNNTHNRQTSVAPVGFEPTISAGERP
jgi:hypothetical protein